MSHPEVTQEPSDRPRSHLADGLCECECAQCTQVNLDGDTLCICPDCDATRCDMHPPVIQEVP